MINTLIKNHSLFIEPNNKTDTNIASHKINFWIDISNDIIVVIGLLIYLEVIIINCYGLNHNVKIFRLRLFQHLLLHSAKDYRGFVFYLWFASSKYQWDNTL